MASLDSYDGIIFDYGGVLVFHQTESDQAKMAAVLGTSLDRFSELYWADRQEYDKDQPAEQYWRAIASGAGVLLSESKCERLRELDTQSWMRYDPVMWEWVEELRSAGKRVAILSNMPRDLGEALRDRTDRFSFFHHVTLSFELKSAKPESAIYHECLQGIGTLPERTLFLDDRIANVQAAQALGIHAVQFTSREDVLPRLRS